ncbi:MAG: ribosome small subunit-dependent GTPase A [Chloroflexi bacterium]|nr:ribosome small subunit-dependent GTPase A [Chloroflexota bacterium]
MIKSQSGFFTVQTAAHEALVSQVRGRLLQERLNTDPVAIGDRVLVSLQPVYENDTVTYTGLIEEVEPRERWFARQRPAPEGRRSSRLPDREQVIIANPDQVLFVFAVTQPDPRFRMLDRFLVIAEHARIPIRIVANKVDLIGLEAAQRLFAVYEKLGYPLHYTSGKENIGLDTLRGALIAKLSAFTGPSGVGKSSLLNAIQPGLGLAVQTISEANLKGRHTTVAPELYPVEGGGYIADTPGIKAIGLYDIEPTELDGYFPDILAYFGQCRFADCRHEKEPGCAVRAAVEAGDLREERYDSYLRLRDEMEEIYYRC